MRSATRAGALTERIAFDAPKATRNVTGGRDSGWQSAAVTCRANFRYLRGGETVQAARLAGRQPVVVTVRATAAKRAITPEWRMRDLRSGAEFNIRTGPVETADRAFLEFTVEGGVAV